MGYVEKNLMQGEKLYARATLHWTVFGKAILFMALSVGLMIFSYRATLDGSTELSSAAWYTGVVILVAGLWFTGEAFVKRQSTELAVTSKRVIAKFGFIRRSTIELNHSKVESFHVEQGVLGRMLGYGTLSINGTGGGITPIPGIGDPLGFRRKAMEAIDAFQSNS
ncbi:MAG: PH domain-containing protein [Chlorobium sp.]|uniref:PH domain-containing protein n=1 Tax=Chlorobium sp. TaxID=1095 RepID=UPI0025C59530|nr:PH domain-containing protein [Chlorobium sp.]MCF8383573.1 PH domain-containing protein [Chlorobium sp.]